MILSLFSLSFLSLSLLSFLSLSFDLDRQPSGKKMICGLIMASSSVSRHLLAADEQIIASTSFDTNRHVRFSEGPVEQMKERHRARYL